MSDSNVETNIPVKRLPSSFDLQAKIAAEGVLKGSGAGAVSSAAFADVLKIFASGNFRGEFVDAASIPTTAEGYTSDKYGNKKPVLNDYIIIKNDNDDEGKFNGIGFYSYDGTWDTDRQNAWKLRFTAASKTAVDALRNLANNAIQRPSTYADGDLAVFDSIGNLISKPLKDKLQVVNKGTGSITAEITIDGQVIYLRGDGGGGGGGNTTMVDVPLLTPMWFDYVTTDTKNWIFADGSYYPNTSYPIAYSHLAEEYETATAKTKSYTLSNGTVVTITYKEAPDGHCICLPDQKSNLDLIYVDATLGTAWYYILDKDNARFAVPRTQYGFHGEKNYVKNPVADETRMLLYFSSGETQGASFNPYPDYDETKKASLINGAKAPDNGWVKWVSVGNVGEAWLKVNDTKVVSLTQPTSASDIIPVAADDVITFANMLNGVVDFFYPKRSNSIHGAVVTLSQSSYNVTGVAPVTYSCRPIVIVKMGDTKLIEGSHYTLTYENEGGTLTTGTVDTRTAKVTVTGIGDYSGVVSFTYTININVKSSITDATVELSPKYEEQTGFYTVTGEAPQSYDVKPTPVVKHNGRTLTLGTDYTYSYSNNSGTVSEAKIATYTGKVTVTGTGAYVGTIEKTFDIYIEVSVPKVDLSGATVVMDTEPVTFTGAIPLSYTAKPDPTVVVDSYELIKGTDYDITYTDNASGTYTSRDNAEFTATLTIAGKGRFKGSLTRDYTVKIFPKVGMNMLTYDTIPEKSVSGPAPQSYDFTDVLPVIHDGDKTLVKDTDYTVSYSDNAKGTITTETTSSITVSVVITAKDGSIYTGSNTVTFNVVINVTGNLTLQTLRENMDAVSVGDTIIMTPVDTTNFDTVTWEVVDLDHVDTVPVEFFGDVWYANYKYFYLDASSAYTEINTTTYATPAAAKEALSVDKLYCKSTKNVTLQTKYLLSKADKSSCDRVFDASSSQLWKDSSIRTWLNGSFCDDVLGQFMLICSDAVVKTRVSSSTEGTTTDKVWLPSIYEVGSGETVPSRSWGKEGHVLDKYKAAPGLNSWDVRSKSSTGGGSVDWWLRSAYNNGSAYTWCVDSSGSLYGSSVDSVYGIAPLITLTPAGTPTYLGNVTGLEVTKSLNSTSGKYRGSVKWTDPKDSYDSNGHPTAEWYSSILVRKEGSEPTSATDGTVLDTLTTRNKYKDTAFEDTTDLNDDSTYYYKVFPVSKTGLVTSSSENCKSMFTQLTVFENNATYSGSLSLAAGTYDVTLVGTGGNSAGYGNGVVGYLNGGSGACVHGTMTLALSTVVNLVIPDIDYRNGYGGHGTETNLVTPTSIVSTSGSTVSIKAASASSGFNQNYANCNMGFGGPISMCDGNGLTGGLVDGVTVWAGKTASGSAKDGAYYANDTYPYGGGHGYSSEGKTYTPMAGYIKIVRIA